MKERRSGVIINIIGAGGEKLDFGYIAGAAGNASLMAFTRAIGGTSPEFGVRVIGVNPGPVMTDRIEVLGRRRAAALYGDENRWRETFKQSPLVGRRRAMRFGQRRVSRIRSLLVYQRYDRHH
jgi:NAD(P)-dependent dehydrogenase (short-subunit alcohol dehydrogenase family)